MGTGWQIQSIWSLETNQWQGVVYARANIMQMKIARKLTSGMNRHRRNILAKSGFKCAYCGKGILDDMTIDHVVPLSRGGSDRPHNKVAACKRCNSLKGNKLVGQFKRISNG